MLNLIVKDYKLLYSSKDGIKKRIISGLVKLLMIACFVAIETFLFRSIISKINGFSKAPITFLTIFLFIISCLMIFINTNRANKLFFDKKDVEQLTSYPVSNSEIIISKLVFLFITHYITSLMFVYPILVSFGMLQQKTLWFYYLGLFYPILSFLFEMGVALLLVYPYKLLGDYLKKNLMIQLFISLVLMFIGCILYQKVLNLFMNIIVDSSSSLFSNSTMQILTELRGYFIPNSFLVDFFIGDNKLRFIPYILISLGVFILGLTVAIYCFNFFRGIRINKSYIKEREIKPKGLFITLIKKEFLLIFKDSNNILSFTGLLVVEPFLLYLIVSSFNTIFKKGVLGYYTIALPSFIPLLNILIIMLFSLIIAQGANQYITNERKTIKVLKTIPVSPIKQVLIKVLVPLTFSLIALLFSYLVLLALSIITFNTFIFGLLLNIIVLLAFNLVSLKEELNVRINKPRGYFLSSLYSYMLPISFFIFGILGTYFGLNVTIMYLLGMVIIILLTLPHIIKIKSFILNSFLDLEVDN